MLCSSTIELENGRVVRIKGLPEHPYSQGAFCVKGVHGPRAALDHPRRLLHPLMRQGPRGAGQWRRVSWSEALDRVADGTQRVVERYGPLALAGAVSSSYFSRGVAINLLLRSLGSPNVMINQDLCRGGRSVSKMVTGLPISYGEETDKTNCMLFVGKSPTESDMVQWRHVRANRARGVPLIVVDPRHTLIAKQADIWLPVRPGTDLALALGFHHVIISEGLYDHDFVTRWCHGFDQLASHVAPFTPRRVAAITGVPAQSLVEAARLYGSTRPAVVVLGHGVDAQVGSVQTSRAFHMLAAITGNIDVPGGHRLAKPYPGLRTYWGLTKDPNLRLPRTVEDMRLGAQQFPLWAGREGFAMACHNPTVIQAMISGKPYPVKALYITGVNIVVTYPGTEDVKRALANLDLVVVSTDNMTPTAELADVVLPKTTLLEEEEVFWHPAGTVNLTQAVLPPCGEAKSDVDAIALLADKLRQRGLFKYDFVFWKDHPDFNEKLLENTDLTLDQLREKGFVACPSRYREYERTGFPTPTGKVELYSTIMEKHGLSPLPTLEDARITVRAPDPDSRYPLMLMSGVRAMTYHHSRFRDHVWARKVEPNPVAWIHPRDAQDRGVADRDWVVVRTPVGSCVLEARLSPDVPEGQIAAGMGWWWPELLGQEGCLSSNVNNAVTYGPPWDAALGSPDVRRLWCEVEKAPAEQTPASAAARVTYSGGFQ